MAEPEWQAEAREQFEQGYQAQMAGRLEDALECYRRSLAIQETAEAHTFLGWAMAHQGKHEDAIEECKRAIAADPSFANPYNEIGSYLIAPGPDQEAPARPKRAKRAPRYQPRPLPHLNL